ncbi:MAG TPA: antibiotic biosynthesis monooxygenase [Bryobacteraceae bacterium]|nr:antibiotic biosynthesis monooxygenase [Bryobacteraceae bacterium]
MVILHVNLHIKPECVEAFKAATIENARNSAMEPGVARFDFVELRDEPTRFELWEVYRTEDAVAAHKQTAHFNTWAQTVADMFVVPRTRTLSKSVFPGDESW